MLGKALITAVFMMSASNVVLAADATDGHKELICRSVDSDHLPVYGVRVRAAQDFSIEAEQNVNLVIKRKLSADGSQSDVRKARGKATLNDREFRIPFRGEATGILIGRRTNEYGHYRAVLEIRPRERAELNCVIHQMP